MSEYTPIEVSVDVPLNTGVEGFLLALKKILRLSRVTDIYINDKGHVTYKRWVREEDDAESNVEIDFETVSPMSVIRNNEIEDLGFLPDDTALSRIAYMFYKSAVDQMYPLAIVIGADSVLPSWFKQSSNIDVIGSQFYGLPLIKDRSVSDDLLLLCTSYGRGGSIVDIRKTYKITMPPREKPIIGGSDASIGSDSQGRSSESERTDRVPAVGVAATKPSGRSAELPDVPRGGGAGHRKGPGR
jgi:hypothetical protein